MSGNSIVAMSWTTPSAACTQADGGQHAEVKMWLYQLAY